MNAITAADYFKAHEKEAGLAIEAPVLKVTPVKSGDKITVTALFGILASVETDEDGFHLDSLGTQVFKTIEDFHQEDLPNLREIPFEDIDSDNKRVLFSKDSVEIIKKGQEITTQPWSDTDLGVCSKAEDDGYLVTLKEDGKPRFYDNFDYKRLFNAKAAANETSTKLYRDARSDKDVHVRYIVLKEGVTFAFEEGHYNAKASMVLYENEKDEDGFTVVIADDFKWTHEVEKKANSPSIKRSGLSPS